jgi:hypothetical protein
MGSFFNPHSVMVINVSSWEDNLGPNIILKMVDSEFKCIVHAVPFVRRMEYLLYCESKNP